MSPSVTMQADTTRHRPLAILRIIPLNHRSFIQPPFIAFMLYSLHSIKRLFRFIVKGDCSIGPVSK